MRVRSQQISLTFLAFLYFHTDSIASSSDGRVEVADVIFLTEQVLEQYENENVSFQSIRSILATIL